MPDFISTIASDNFRLARSKTLQELADGTYNIINLPKFTFVHGVIFYVTQAYAGGAGGSATIGFTGNGESADPDGFMDATAADGRATGYKHSIDDGQPASKGKWFNAAGGQVTITLAKSTDTTLLIGYVFVKYSVLH